MRVVGRFFGESGTAPVEAGANGKRRPGPLSWSYYPVRFCDGKQRVMFAEEVGLEPDFPDFQRTEMVIGGRPPLSAIVRAAHVKILEVAHCTVPTAVSAGSTAHPTAITAVTALIPLGRCPPLAENHKGRKPGGSLGGEDR